MNNPYDIALTMVPKLSAKGQRLAILRAGSAENLFRMSKEELFLAIGDKSEAIDCIRNKTMWKQVETEMKFIERYDIKALSFHDKEYPWRMNRQGCEDCPTVLYTLGEVNLNPKYSVSVVGTRRASEYGRSATQMVINQLPNKDMMVVSGLALGIDTQAHQSAIENSIPTVGVLGHGLNMLYPESNRLLAKKMMTHQGGLVTEYHSQSEVNRYNFPARNRIIAAMSDVVLVMEAEEKGGALITARIAKEYGVEVYALPGRTMDKYSQGCNALISNQQAKILYSAEQLLADLNWEQARNITKCEPVNENESLIWACLQESEGLTIEEISQKTSLSASKISSITLEMEFKGTLKRLPGNKYKAI